MGHSRQCVGSTKPAEPPEAFIHPLNVRRHGNTSAWTSTRSITLSCSSHSSGAEDMECQSVMGLRLPEQFDPKLVALIDRRLAIYQSRGNFVSALAGLTPLRNSH